MRRFKLHASKKAAAILIPLALALSCCSSAEERAQAYYAAGMKLLSEHDEARASVEFKNAVKYNKNLLPAWKALADIEEKNKNFSGLIGDLRAVVELQPDDNLSKLKLARLLGVAGGVEEAMNLVKSVEAKEPQNAELLGLKAVLFFKLKDYDDAVRAAQATLALKPASVDAIMTLAGERLERGDAKAALAILDSNPAVGEDLAIMLFKLKIVSELRDFPKAEAILKKFIALQPKDMQLREQLIKVYLAERRTEEAEKEARNLVAAYPDEVKSKLLLVQIIYLSKGVASAREELVSQIAGAKDPFPLQIALAKLDYTQGNFADASKLLQSLIDGNDTKENKLLAEAVLAEMRLAKKDVDGAEKLVSDIIQKDSHNIQGLKLRAAIRLQKGKPELAIDDLRQALNDQPNSADLMLDLAGAYDRGGLIELAEKQFANAIAASKYDPQIGLAYIAFLERRGNLARAEEVAVDLSDRWPRNVNILKALGDIRIARQNWVGAQQVADSIRKAGNDDVDADRLLGASLMGLSKFDESINALERGYNAAPSDTRSLATLVRAYIGAQKTDRALAFLQTALKANPSNAEAWVYLGSIQRLKEQPGEAEKSFTMAITKQPKDPAGYQALSQLYLSQNKQDQAAAIIENGLAQQPDSGVLLLISAGLEESKGNYPAAIAKYEHMLQKEPGSLIAANNLASVLVDHSTDKVDLERAASLAAVLKQSPVPQFKDTLGWIDYLRGDFRSAIQLLEPAANALPRQPWVHYHLGMSYLANGEPQKAAEQLNQALSNTTDDALKEKVRAALQKLPT